MKTSKLGMAFAAAGLMAAAEGEAAVHMMERSARTVAPRRFSGRSITGPRDLGAVAAGMVDVQQMPLYDRVIIAANTATTNPILFFTTPIGQGVGISGGVKQIWDTNMTQAQRLEAPRSFLVRAVRFYVEPDTTFSDILNLYKNYILVLIVGDKTYQLAPIWFFPQGGGAYSAGNLTTARLASTLPEQFYGNGFPDPNSINIIAENLAVKIEQGENFRVELQGNSFTTAAAGGTTFGTGLNMRVALDGVLSRQVQ